MDAVLAHIRQRFAGTGPYLEYYEALWEEYAGTGLADSIFVTQITSGNDEAFWQRTWEMLLAHHLMEQGHPLTSKDEGPDFKFEVGTKVVWCEAICPSPKGLPAEWLAPAVMGNTVIMEVPAEAVLLRWTAAVKEKWEKLEGCHRPNRKTGEMVARPGYRQKGIVADDECYVVAVNGCQLSPHTWWEFRSMLPIILQAVLPLGPLKIPIKDFRLQMDEAAHSYRPEVSNANDSPVPTDNFLDPSYAGISAVLGSVRRHGMDGGLDVVVVHNPLARAPLPIGILGATREYIPHAIGDGEYNFRLAER